MADISKIEGNDIKDAVARSGLADKLDSANPTGTGSLSLNRKANTTTGNQSVAVGSDCEASGNYSFAEGYRTKAAGNYSHAQGESTIADGNYAVSEGADSKASGNFSHAHGWNTRATNRSQMVFGECNEPDPNSANPTQKGTYIEIVGKGTADNARSNARTLDWNGNETLAGDLTINGNQSLTTALTISTGNVNWNDTTVTGDQVRKAYQQMGKLVIANLEYTPKSGQIANGNVICTGLPTPKYAEYNVYGGNSQQVKLLNTGALIFYYPSDTTTLKRTELTVVYFAN